MDTPRVITATQRIQLIGLVALGQGYFENIEDVEEAACEITGEEVGGHTSDMIFAHRGTGKDVDRVLELLKISVEPDVEPEEEKPAPERILDDVENTYGRGARDKVAKILDEELPF